jgi:four helix bundle protein
MTEDETKMRTKQFAPRVLRLVGSLPRELAADVVGRQLLRSATSVGANYRSACRAKSRRDLYSRLGIVEEEADESANWLELLVDTDAMPAKKLSLLRQEADELVRNLVASRPTLRKSIAAASNQRTRINPKSSAAQ